MAGPNQYIRSSGGILTPNPISGTDVTDALGLSSTVAQVSDYIESIPSLSSQVDTNTSNISTLSSDLLSLNNSTLSSQIDTLSSDVQILSSQQATDISNISDLSSSVISIDSDISSLSSDTGSISSDVVSLSASINKSDTVLDGTTAGTVTYGQSVINGTGHFVASFSGYENDTDVNQVIPFPTPYTQIPMLLSNISGLAFTVTNTDLTITAPNSTALFNGVVIVDGIVG